MPKLILDAMGGDHAPQAMLDGAARALNDLEGELILVGDEKILRSLLRKKRRLKPLHQALIQTEKAATSDSMSKPRCAVSLIHASETIEMGDSIRSVRTKPEASINIGCRLAATSWKNYKQKSESEPAALISAGHSGAVMASALISMGRLEEVDRPAIAVRLPSLSLDGCVVLDVGANIDCKPEHLRDFAVMGTVFSRVGRKSESPPRVAVLSNGEERSKGNELTRAAVALIEKLPCFAKAPQHEGRVPPIGIFQGYAEGKEIFQGSVDVVVTDGFVGNILLKSAEGMGKAIVALLKREAKTSPFALLGFALLAGVVRRLKKRLDYAEIGAAPLLGVAGYAFVCHGRSTGRAMRNALLWSQSAIKSRFVEQLEETLKTQRKGHS